MTSRRDFLGVAGASMLAAFDVRAQSSNAAAGWGARIAAANLPGLSVAVLSGGRVTRTWQFGVAHGTVPVGIHTRFQAASISKPVTAIAAARLVQRGLLSFDDPVLPRLRSWRPKADLDAWSRITLRQLLTHSAGLTVSGFPGYAAGAPRPTVPQILDGCAPANTPAVAATLPVGKWKYSGGGTTVAMLLMTDVTGRDFAELMDDLVIRPLGLRDSSFRQPPTPNPRLAWGHDAAGKPLTGDFHVYPEQSAAGLWTTPSNLCRIAASLMPGGHFRDVADIMLQPQPGLSLGRNRMGVGFMLGAENEPASFFHNGGNEGFRAFLGALPETGQGIAMMWNGEASIPIRNEMMRAVAAFWATMNPTPTPG
jgi:CubicO group peptidase (beta-lactamase class C family)